jgi:putative endonuclease
MRILSKQLACQPSCVEFLPCVYILTNQRHGTLYVGVTSNLAQRVWTHKEGLVDGFTKKYRLKRLVYYESFDSMHAAISREKSLKCWRRLWKIRLIEGVNPGWNDLSDTL